MNRSIHTLDNSHLQIRINSLGAELCSVFSKERLVEYLWQADPAVWPRHAPVLFPVVGKLKDNRYLFNEQVYELPQHGFARDKPFTCIEETDTSLAFQLKDTPDTQAVYPFSFSLIIRYELVKESIHVSYEVNNAGGHTMYYSIGAHPGFKCPIMPGETMRDYVLTCRPATQLQVSVLQDGLLTGETYTWPLQEHTLPVSPELFERDALVMLNGQLDAVSLTSTKSGRGVSLESRHWPCYGIWSKKGSGQFVCLEPWQGVADREDSAGDLRQKPYIHALNAGEEHIHSYTMRFY